ncbi:MAG TPA: hypothetical protein VFW62_11380, partial [bacterium]|nr:hypothetical protein [bacterium]
GIEFQCLLRPSLLPGRRVRVDSDALKGVFKLTKVSHQGDNMKGDFLSECESKVKKKKAA